MSVVENVAGVVPLFRMILLLKATAASSANEIYHVKERWLDKKLMLLT